MPPDEPGGVEWLGASPDGLLRGPDGGVLEVKCPANKGLKGNAGGTFADATPFERMPAYYVPQVLGQMAVFGRPYAELFCYTRRNGCTSFRVDDAPAVWALARDVLRDFWHLYVLPARAARRDGATDTDIERWRPRFDEARSSAIIAECKRLAAEARTQRFPSPSLGAEAR